MSIECHGRRISWCIAPARLSIRAPDLAQDDHGQRLTDMRHHSNDDRKPAGHAGGFLRHHPGGNVTLTLLRRLFALAIASGALAAGGNAAHSQARVEGQPDAVHIEARDVPLREVFDALQAKFNLRYRTNDPLDTRMTGTFNGPLRRVAARILDGYDFAMKITPQGIDVLVLRQFGADEKAVAATPAPAPPKGSPAPVLTAAQANRYERGQVR
jgi:hypothetical protein